MRQLRAAEHSPLSRSDGAARNSTLAFQDPKKKKKILTLAFRSDTFRLSTRPHRKCRLNYYTLENRSRNDSFDLIRHENLERKSNQLLVSSQGTSQEENDRWTQTRIAISHFSHFTQGLIMWGCRLTRTPRNALNWNRRRGVPNPTLRSHGNILEAGTWYFTKKQRWSDVCTRSSMVYPSMRGPLISRDNVCWTEPLILPGTGDLPGFLIKKQAYDTGR